MLTTNDPTSRVKADNGRLRPVTTDAEGKPARVDGKGNLHPIKRKPLPSFPFNQSFTDNFPDVKKREQKKTDKNFIQTTDLEDIKRKLTLKAKMAEIKAAPVEAKKPAPNRRGRKKKV